MCVTAPSRMIWVYENDSLREVPTFLEALEACDRPVISAVGAGGKTTTLHRLADEFVRAGQQAVVTTTTHIMEEELPYFYRAPEDPALFLQELRRYAEEFGQVWTGAAAAGGKLKILPLEMMDQIWKLDLPVLIEADGARRMPVKVPAGHEPVIHPRTTHVLSLYGLDALGKRMEEVCFRAELAEQILHKERTERITEEDLAILAVSRESGRRGCPEGAEYIVVLNKADSQKRRDEALSICRKLKGCMRGTVIVTSHAGMRREDGLSAV